MKESVRKSSDEQFSFKYFLYISFVREISPNKLNELTYRVIEIYGITTNWFYGTTFFFIMDLRLYKATLVALTSSMHWSMLILYLCLLASVCGKEKCNIKLYMFMVSFTHSCLEIYLTVVVWTCHNFENNFGIKHKFAKHLKESCR